MTCGLSRPGATDRFCVILFFDVIMSNFYCIGTSFMV